MSILSIYRILKRTGKERREFAEAYAFRSGVTVEWLRRHGQEARPCNCGEDICKGWQMAHVEEGE